jgi:membrane protein CcdC involved in cytochrome C biogenesis
VFDNPLIVIATSIVGALAILVWRIRETQRPISPRAILLPPLGMSTGLAIFAIPAFRVPWTWGLTAFAAGAIGLAYPLMRSSKLRVENGAVMMQRSRAFLAILLGLATLRIGLRDYVGHLLPPRETASVFFLLAFGMIVRWRVWMYLRYRAITRNADATRAPAIGAARNR